MSFRLSINTTIVSPLNYRWMQKWNRKGFGINTEEVKLKWIKNNRGSVFMQQWGGNSCSSEKLLIVIIYWLRKKKKEWRGAGSILKRKEKDKRQQDNPPPFSVRNRIKSRNTLLIDLLWSNYILLRGKNANAVVLGCFMWILPNRKSFKVKLQFNISFTHCKNDIVKFSMGDELFIKGDNGFKLTKEL